MAEEKNEGAFSGVKQMWAQPKARKSILIVGGMAIVVLGVSYSLAGKQTKKPVNVPAKVSIATPTAGGMKGDQLSPTSPEYKELVRQKDQERLAEASATPGAMVLPKIAGLSDPAAKPVVPAMTADVVKSDTNAQLANTQNQVQYGINPSPVGGDRMRQSPAYLAAKELFTTQLKNGLNPEGTWEVVRAPAATQNGSPAAGAAIPGMVTPPQDQAPRTQTAQYVDQTPRIYMGATLFGTLDTAINTDYSGPVKATIQQGKFAGAQLMGGKTLEYDAVVIKFTSMSLNNGEPAVPIEAYAVSISDAKKFGSAGLSGSVDRHVISRYVVPAAMAFVSGYGQAAAQAGTQVTTNAGGYTQSTSALNARDRWITAAGVAVQPLFSDLQRQAARPITITLDANTEIGIMFAKDVLPPKPPGTAGANHVQAQQQYAPADNQSVQQMPANQVMSPAQIQALQQQQALQMQQQYGRQPVARPGYSYGQPYGYTYPQAPMYYGQ